MNLKKRWYIVYYDMDACRHTVIADPFDDKGSAVQYGVEFATTHPGVFVFVAETIKRIQAAGIKVEDIQ